MSIDSKHFIGFLPQIKDATDAVINLSTGGSLTNTISERIAPAKLVSPEMTSLYIGSMNFSMHPLASKYKSWRFDWEHDYLASSDSCIFRNTFRDIAMVARELGEEEGVKFEYEWYDVGHLYNLKFCIDTGMFKPPGFIQFALEILGGIGADIENLIFMKRTADKLFGNNYRLSVLGAGASQMDLATAAATMGGNVRVGLEDSLFISRGQLVESNAQQVSKIRRMLAEHGLEAASQAEAREMLGLKRQENTKF